MKNTGNCTILTEDKTMEPEIQSILEEACKYAAEHLDGGKVAAYIPELAKADPKKLGVCLTMKDGTTCTAGEADTPFTVQSIGKTFALILALQTAGFEKVFSRVGMEPSGDSFDSIIQLELKNWTPYNPLINCGAIATASCIESETPFEDYLTLLRTLCDDPSIRLSEETYQSEKETGNRNRAITYLLANDGIIGSNAEQVLDLYFRFCSVLVTARGLAHYAMILANGGVHPRTGRRLLDAEIVKVLKTLMFLCGMYDESGEFAVRVGLPAKSGVGGGIMAVAPRGMGIATYGPALNKKGNSVGGERILEYISGRMNLHLLQD